MSISTGSICSFGDYASSFTSSMSGKVINDPGIHEDTPRAAQLPGWCNEIHGKICVYDGDIGSYLRTFVPSRTPCPLDAPATALGLELTSGTPLLDVFRALVADFPADKKPSFYGGHGQVIPFPFAEFASRHHASKPDLVMSFPGVRLPEKIESPDWSQFSVAIEVKDMEDEDPFARSTSTDFSAARASKFVQLAVSARVLMFANGFLASFMLGIYGDVVRIARFDYTCCVASAPVSLKTAEGLRAVQEFFWRRTGAVVGADPTVRKLTTADTTWLREHLGSDADLLDDVDIDEARWVKVWDDDKPTDPRAFILFRLLNVNARLFSRSTMVWLGIEDARFCNGESNAETDEHVELRVIKEAWRQVIRIPEQKFYTRLKEEIPDEERIGLPDLLCGGDLGERDVKRWEAACAAKVWYTVGRPLSCFKTTKELVMALRDAIVGHQLAMKRAGVSHRDISSGNVLIVDHLPVTRPLSYGVLLDYDYSSMTLVPPDDFEDADPAELPPLYPLAYLDKVDPETMADLKERMGTYYFIALELLESGIGPVMHDTQHDLESFYWVLLWTVLRHTAHNHPDGRHLACASVFKSGDDRDAWSAKCGWVHANAPFIIDQNSPLTDLMAHLRDLLRIANAPYGPTRRRITYGAFLDAFDAAIAREDWPDDDPALPFAPPKTSGPLASMDATASDVVSAKRRRMADATLMDVRRQGEHVVGRRLREGFWSGYGLGGVMSIRRDLGRRRPRNTSPRTSNLWHPLVCYLSGAHGS
ncbi:uncharacterized protein TRAVEDRAFT_21480 [Trametes versicolor FP-101664 SS1]|uniref:uncharacterized protein n=1 Tax=Trametes versicolor (strain FP-101664) TaxID=717944 RepID=UPI0004623767|nr:uncharacterized protein TRAVEDRAFT_21480 [Trametes versicolor FP-101664 SS1]EIW58068.1 hypothetical protein TRAVEDRAFT_21480 [Trametes versicolor FP-101664 SS1]